MYEYTSQTFIILIDEYDVLVREQVPKKLFDGFLSFLNVLFKSDTLRPAISLAYITGILSVVCDKVQSKLITIILTLKNADTGMMAIPWEAMKSITPNQLLCAWRREALKDIGVKHPRIGLSLTEYGKISRGTKDDVFTYYLLHLGYLAYNMEEKTCHIPNREVRQEWFNAIEGDDYEWLSYDFDAISFEKGMTVREAHKNLFDNKEYQSKLTAGQMLKIAREEFEDGYIEKL